MPVAAEVDLQVETSRKVLERSDQDGELYAKPTIGIIYPPPEVRNIVDRTANFVARNGPEFEDRIRDNEADNPKFNFLNPNDPYHAYYQHKLKEFREAPPEEAAPVQKPPPVQQVLLQKKQVAVIEPIVPKEPPPTYEYMIDPPTISAMDLDIVRLTAQFVAKNGKDFLTNLMNREQRNYQFDFLRPQHSLFQYFTRLVEQYTKILLPPADLTDVLQKDVEDPWKILERVRYRVEWQKYQEREKKKVEDEKEKERIAFAQIDWHDFVVVETVNFREDESANLPPPVTKEQLGARLLAQERAEKQEEDGEDGVPAEDVGMELEDEEEEDLYQPYVVDDKEEEEDKDDSDMEEESEDEDDSNKRKKKRDKKKKTDTGSEDIFGELGEREESEEDSEEEERERQRRKKDKKKKDLDDMPPPLPPPIPGVNAPIRKGYNPKAPKPPPPAAAPPSDKYLISPLTGERVPVESMAEHMKINLLDPRWKEQNEKLIEEKRQQEQVFAEGVHIGDTLKQLAERRSDIFGVAGEETMIGRKLGEEELPKASNKDIWDGHTASMERATKLAHSNITLDKQIEAIHRSKGLLPTEDLSKIGPAVPESSKPKPPEPPKHHPLPMSMPGSSNQGCPPPPVINIASSQMKNNEPPLPPLPIPMPPPPKQPQPPLLPQPPMNPPQPPNRPPMLPPPPGMPPNLGPPMMMPPGPPNQPPNMPPMPPMMPPLPPMQPPRMMPPPAQIELPPLEDDDEPVPKKSKMEEMEAELIPEDRFLEKYRVPVTFRVQVPDMRDKTEWQCHGQMLKLVLPLTDQCSVIKAKIHEEIGMPAGKQKLQLGNFFVKDSNSLAYYNFTSASVVQLQVKERGGRKK